MRLVLNKTRIKTFEFNILEKGNSVQRYKKKYQNAKTTKMQRQPKQDE